MRHPSTTPTRLAGGILLAALLVAAPSLMAATITVDNTTCTLADAIASANSDSAVGGCAAGLYHDVITLTADVTLTERLPDITSGIDIVGGTFPNPGGPVTTIARDPAADPFRIFTVLGDATYFVLVGVTVTGGYDEFGGGIAALAGAELALLNSTVSGNHSIFAGGGVAVVEAYFISSYSKVSENSMFYPIEGLPIEWSQGGGVASSYGSETVMLLSEVSDNFGVVGGGIANSYGADTLLGATTVSGNTAAFGGGVSNTSYAEYGDDDELEGLSLSYSTVKDNQAIAAGGSINAYDGSEQYVSYSEISGNYSSYGPAGGLANAGGADLEMVNTTVSGNTAGGDGGGLLNVAGATAVLRNTTFSGNAAGADDDGGAVYNGGGTVTAYGSVFAYSTPYNCFGGPVDQGGNLDDDGSCGFGTPLLTGLDPNLDTNGAVLPVPFPGLFIDLMMPRTHALDGTSTAIDAAGDCGFGSDQRGFVRDDGDCDSGAYEYNRPPRRCARTSRSRPTPSAARAPRSPSRTSTTAPRTRAPAA